MKLRGFTLIELLVAIVIFALVAVMAYRGLNAVIEAHTRVASASQKWRDLSLFFSRLGDDVTHPAHRPIRDINGLPQAEWVGQSNYLGEYGANLTLTRMGAGDHESQRVAYRFKQGVIEELIWPSLDQAPLEKPAIYVLLSGIKTFKLNYLTLAHQWVASWPLVGQKDGLPQALQVSLELDSGEHIERIFALP